MVGIGQDQLEHLVEECESIAHERMARLPAGDVPLLCHDEATTLAAYSFDLGLMSMDPTGKGIVPKFHPHHQQHHHVII